MRARIRREERGLRASKGRLPLPLVKRAQGWLGGDRSEVSGGGGERGEGSVAAEKRVSAGERRGRSGGSRSRSSSSSSSGSSGGREGGRGIRIRIRRGEYIDKVVVERRCRCCVSGRAGAPRERESERERHRGTHRAPIHQERRDGPTATARRR